MEELPEIVNIIDKLNEECQREVDRHDKMIRSYWKVVMTELIWVSYKRKESEKYQYLKTLLHTDEGMWEYRSKYPNGSLDIKLENYKYLSKSLKKLLR